MPLLPPVVQSTRGAECVADRVWFERRVEAGESLVGRPLGQALRRLGVSLRLLRRLKRTGGLRVNGVPVHADYRLQAGDRIQLVGNEDSYRGWPSPPAFRPWSTPGSGSPGPLDWGPPVVPEDVPLDILYEDEHLLAVAKPPGRLTHPVKRERSGTLANGVARYWQTGVVHPVHRLDRETSGVVVFARDPYVHRRLQAAIDAGKAVKEYLALVAFPQVLCHEGTFSTWPLPAGGVIDRPLAPVPGHGSRQQIPAGQFLPVGGRPQPGPAAGRKALTEYRVLRFLRPNAAGALPSFALLHVIPHTGRTHQIRVHLAAAGWPLVGDPLYGPAPEMVDLLYRRLCLPETAGTACPAPARAPFGGLMGLHAWRLTFPHPMTGKSVQVVAPVPPELPVDPVRLPPTSLSPA